MYEIKPLRWKKCNFEVLACSTPFGDFYIKKGNKTLDFFTDDYTITKKYKTIAEAKKMAMELFTNHITKWIAEVK